MAEMTVEHGLFEGVKRESTISGKESDDNVLRTVWGIPFTEDAKTGMSIRMSRRGSVTQNLESKVGSRYTSFQVWLTETESLGMNVEHVQEDGESSGGSGGGRRRAVDDFSMEPSSRRLMRKNRFSVRRLGLFRRSHTRV